MVHIVFIGVTEGESEQQINIAQHPAITRVSLSGPAVLIERIDGSVQIFQGDESVISSRQTYISSAECSIMVYIY